MNLRTVTLKANTDENVDELWKCIEALGPEHDALVTVLLWVLEDGRANTNAYHHAKDGMVKVESMLKVINAAARFDRAQKPDEQADAIIKLRDALREYRRQESER